MSDYVTCENPPCDQVGPFRYCPIKGCNWIEPAEDADEIKAEDYEGLISGAEAMGVKASTRAERAYWNGYGDGVRALRQLLAAAGRKPTTPIAPSEASERGGS